MPLTPEQVTANQLAYIAEERHRYTALRDAFAVYRATAKALGLHALTPNEIDDRFHQLDQMAIEAETPEYQARHVQISIWQEKTP